MNCIDDGLIQKFIDGEASAEEVKLVNRHISDCQVCDEKIDQQKKLAIHMKEVLDTLVADDIEIPAFSYPGQNNPFINTNIKRFLYALSAACVLFFGVWISDNGSQEEMEEVVFYNNVDWEFDANKPITDQQMIIKVIDADGNVSEYPFE